jgi:hypothetical protein
MEERQELQRRGDSQEQRSVEEGFARGAPWGDADVRGAVLSEWKAQSRLERWKDGVRFGAGVFLLLAAFAVLAVIMLSDSYSPEVKEEIATLVKYLISGLLGFQVGKIAEQKK